MRTLLLLIVCLPLMAGCTTPAPGGPESQSAEPDVPLPPEFELTRKADPANVQVGMRRATLEHPFELERPALIRFELQWSMPEAQMELSLTNGDDVVMSQSEQVAAPGQWKHEAQLETGAHVLRATMHGLNGAQEIRLAGEFSA